MALVPGASSGGVFRRSREPETLTDEAVDLAPLALSARSAIRKLRRSSRRAPGRRSIRTTRRAPGGSPASRAKLRNRSSTACPISTRKRGRTRRRKCRGKIPCFVGGWRIPIRSAASGDDLDTLAKANAQYQQLRQGNWFQRTFPGMFMASSDWNAIQQHQISEAYAKAAQERRANAAAADSLRPGRVDVVARRCWAGERPLHRGRCAQ